MDLTKALEVLNAATGQYKGSRDEHVTIQEALRAIDSGINRLQVLEQEQQDCCEKKEDNTQDPNPDSLDSEEKNEGSSSEVPTDNAKTD